MEEFGKKLASSYADHHREMDNRTLGSLNFEVISQADLWEEQRQDLLGELRGERYRVVEYLEHLAHRMNRVQEGTATIERAHAEQDPLGEFSAEKLQPRLEILEKAANLIEMRDVVINQIESEVTSAQAYLREIDDHIERLSAGLQEVVETHPGLSGRSRIG